MSATLASASGAAFPLVVRLGATALVGGVALQAAAAAPQLRAADWAPAGLALLAAASALILAVLWWIWRSRIEAGPSGLRQSWLWDKQVRWDEVVQARVVGVPGLHWLLAPRLIVRSRGGAVQVFHVADPTVLAVTLVRLGQPPA